MSADMLESPAIVVNKSYVKTFVSNKIDQSEISDDRSSSAKTTKSKSAKKSKRIQRILNVSQQQTMDDSYSKQSMDMPKTSNWSKLKTRLV